MLVFFYDILIYSYWKEHLQHVETTLRILEEQHFYVKLSKCEFRLTENLSRAHYKHRWSEGA